MVETQIDANNVLRRTEGKGDDDDVVLLRGKLGLTAFSESPAEVSIYANI